MILLLCLFIIFYYCNKVESLSLQRGRKEAALLTYIHSCTYGEDDGLGKSTSYEDPEGNGIAKATILFWKVAYIVLLKKEKSTERYLNSDPGR